MKNCLQVIRVFILIFIISQSIHHNENFTSKLDVTENRTPKYVKYDEEFPNMSLIFIGSDQSFEDYDFPGDGTKNNPYIIFNYSVNYIEIVSTSKYFKIINCTVNRITLDSIADHTAELINNTVTSSIWDIWGIEVRNINSLNIVNNTVYNCSTRGIYCILCSSILIKNNNISLNGLKKSLDSYANAGIMLEYSTGCFIENNTLSNNNYGISLKECRYMTIINNNFINDGLYIINKEKKDYTTHTIYNNKVDNKEIGYFINLDSVTISKPFGGLILFNCTNVTIKNQAISNTDIGILLIHCNRSFIINNNLSRNDISGIVLQNCNKILVSNNSIAYNYRYGLWTWSIPFTDWQRSEIWITYNLFKNNSGYGLIISGDVFYIHHNNFIYNNPGEKNYQCIQSGNDFFWYDTESLTGNYWKHSHNNDSLKIENSIAPGDLYPLSEPCPPYFGNFGKPWTENSTTSAPFFSLLFVVLTFLMIIYAKDTIKTNK